MSREIKKRLRKIMQERSEGRKKAETGKRAEIRNVVRF